MSDWPELTFPGAEGSFVRETYDAASVILEYGSGGSTIYAARGAGRLIFSVESDVSWARDLQRKVDRGNLPSPPIIYPVDIGATGDWGRPVDPSQWQKFHRYPVAIWSEPFFRSPDVILIDGRFRPACFVASCLRMNQRTRILFDDYVNRQSYHIVEELVKPIMIVGRLACFDVEPRTWPNWVQDLLLDLCTEATFSTQKIFPYRRDDP